MMAAVAFCHAAIYRFKSQLVQLAIGSPAHLPVLCIVSSHKQDRQHALDVFLAAVGVVPQP